MTEKTDRVELVKRLHRLAQAVGGTGAVDICAAVDIVTAQPAQEPKAKETTELGIDFEVLMEHDLPLDRQKALSASMLRNANTAPPSGQREGMLRAEVCESISMEVLNEWYSIIHDDGLDIGDRLQRLSVRIAKLTRTVEELKVNAEGVSHGHS